MVSYLKEIGKNTSYEFARYRVNSPMPSRNRTKGTIMPTIIDNEWYDVSGNSYRLIDKVLYITADDYFKEDGFSIVEYINQLPTDFTVVLKIKSKANEVAGYNMLFNRLSSFPTNKNVVIDITDFRFSEKTAFDIENLPNNVKITSMLDYLKKEETYLYSNESFESWSLNCNDENFNILITKLTKENALRLSRMRQIALNFYRFLPDKIKNGTNNEKIDFAYRWCCDNIMYDVSAIKHDGSLNFDRRDSQDPLFTYDRRKGVCKGRARLLKLLLNNYYTNVPCFLVNGMAGVLQHTWNEAILSDDSIIDIDISKQTNRVATDHDELSHFDSDRSIKRKTKQY